MGFWTGFRRAQRGMYKTQRVMGDVNAAKRGRLGRRVVRRNVTRRLMRGLWGN